MKEIWKDIPEYKGYQVSSLGRVRTYNKTTHTKIHGERHWKNRIIKQKTEKRLRGSNKDYRVILWKDNKPKTFLVSRLVAFTFFNKDINSDLTVNHIDGNASNNNIKNLEIVSYKENISHAFKNNLIKTAIKVKIINKEDGNVFYPISLTEGSKLINQNHGYLSLKIKRNQFENKKYKWELV